MMLSKFHNRRLAALLSLMAMVLFIVVFGVHTDELHYGTRNASIITFARNASPSGLIEQQESPSSESYCVACELMALGAGNTTIASSTQINPVNHQESISLASKHSFCCDNHNSLPSRAPPA